MPILLMKVKHFSWPVDYENSRDCPVYRAAISVFGEDITVGPSRINKLGNRTWVAEIAKIQYTGYNFNEDITKVGAMQNPDPELVVRELEYELI